MQVWSAHTYQVSSSVVSPWCGGGGFDCVLGEPAAGRGGGRRVHLSCARVRRQPLRGVRSAAGALTQLGRHLSLSPRRRWRPPAAHLRLDVLANPPEAPDVPCKSTEKTQTRITLEELALYTFSLSKHFFTFRLKQQAISQAGRCYRQCSLNFKFREFLACHFTTIY